LPDGSTKQATHTAILPFKSLSEKARRADVLPGLRPNSLVSVSKLANADYTTIFHLQGEGVTVHEKINIQVKLLSKPVLQGWLDANGLWRLSSYNENQTVWQQLDKIAIYNWYHLTLTVGIKLRGPSKHSRATS
jgi:hypothetical protein